ncbi:Copia protein [Arachis hypogaea]|nr:Copia protein [Arachis hypogaea]
MTITRSSTEVEYRALANTICELLWILNLLVFLHVSCDRAPFLFCDNQSALHIAANPVFHEHTKYLDVDCYLVRQKTQAGVMKLLPVFFCGQLAYIFTKPLPTKPTYLRRGFSTNTILHFDGGILNPPPSTTVKRIKPKFKIQNKQLFFCDFSFTHIFPLLF